MNKIFLAFISLCFFTSVSQAQTKGISPMHQFFKQYADSTIIVEYPTDSYNPPSYKIMSKTNDTVNCFTYLPVDKSVEKVYGKKTGLPKVLKIFIQLHKVNFKNMPANINIFFDLVNLHADTAKNLWNSIQKLKLWQLADDKTFGNGCPKDKPHAVILDGTVAIIYLITKKEIKMLQFDNPWEYEEQCPGNKNRQAVIKFYKLLDQYLPK